jgi:hypothetical protein
VSGQASATSSGTSTPASAAIDGDAGTDWCPSSWTGSLVVDLGQVRSLTDLGITVDASSPSADATIQTASTAGNWRVAAKNIALDPGNPMYVPLPRGTQARYAQLTGQPGHDHAGQRRQLRAHAAVGGPATRL